MHRNGTGEQDEASFKAELPLKALERRRVAANEKKERNSDAGNVQWIITY